MRHSFLSIVAPIVLAAPLHVYALCTAPGPNGAVIESTPTGAFLDHGDGTVTHTLTGLMWKRCPQGMTGAACATGTVTGMTWKAALAGAVSDTTAGFTDWRVPNKKELESIVESCGSSPAINTTVFPATPVNFVFWTSSTHRQFPLEAWAVYFANNGNTMVDTKFASTHFARLVRKGSSGGSFDAAFPAHADVDGNGAAEPLTDGLLMLRYLFGLRGAALIQNAVGQGAQRTTAPQIESHLQSILPK